MDFNKYVLDLCVGAKVSSKELARLGIKEKNQLLQILSQRLLENTEYILEANQKDIKVARENNLKESFIERLSLDVKKVQYMANVLENVSLLKDVIDQYDNMKTLENGLVVGKKRVPLGVVCLIFESRPNVVIDSFSLCFKTGNSVILRGGKEAINTNLAIVEVVQKALVEKGYNKNFIQLVEDTSREIVPILTRQNKYIDVIIPRGSDSLIQAVVQNSTVPVIETGVGNCHVYVDKYADLDKAIKVVNNAKTHRVSVCNAMETLLIHDDIAESYLPKIIEVLDKSMVEYRCCEKSIAIIGKGELATEEDYSKEFLDYILAIKVVNNIDEAISHIDKYGTLHSEAIITENYTLSQRFLNEIDASTVYVNASTRFTDGDMFGFGGEIGISTQKLHARGPMGLEALTTYKYVVYGDGQIRE